MSIENQAGVTADVPGKLTRWPVARSREVLSSFVPESGASGRLKPQHRARAEA